MLKILKLLDKEFKFDVIKFYFLLFVVTIFEFLAVFIILPVSQVFFKKEIEVSDEIKNELDRRLQIIEEDKTEYYSWNDVKNHLKEIRK